MPGHKLGAGIPEGALKEAGSIDLTEIPGTDNLHYPDGIIREAQELAAGAFGADETYFLVNGSTCGIQAAIMTVCKPGDSLIVGRDCHKSVISGMILAGVQAIYVKPVFNSFFGVGTVITPEAVRAAMAENPGAAGLLITRPNYYGVCSEIEKIAEIVHSFGKVLMVDEAHGAHLRFNKELPACSMDGGADICIQSAHKTLPAFTQGAYLHVKGDRTDRERLRFNLRLLQTSSPSYIIMASLDVARAVMQWEGNELLDKTLGYIERFYGNVSHQNGLEILKENSIEGGSLDKTRLVLNFRKMGITGFFAGEALRARNNIQVEMSDYYNIICIATVADRSGSFDALAEALKAFPGADGPRSEKAVMQPADLPIPRQAVSFNEIRYAVGKMIKIDACAGRVSMSMITPYPPGIPVICPGEVISEEALEYLKSIYASGGTINGLDEDMKVFVAE